MSAADPTICSWAQSNPLLERYHDEEWGRPVFDEPALFELITLEGAQAGLSWLTVLRKREGYRKAFASFDPQRVAGFDGKRADQLVLNPDIIRHRGKIESTINNARRILALWNNGQTLADICWELVDGKPLQNNWQRMAAMPSTSNVSAQLSKRLKKWVFALWERLPVMLFYRLPGWLTTTSFPARSTRFVNPSRRHQHQHRHRPAKTERAA
ncbi:MAG: DNA-3-methyladenine glycosylase I [Xanthomonadales bacterium]|nr:DNA-3-methyladenine glycosylase I [Xanthomonadales bacterium]